MTTYFLILGAFNVVCFAFWSRRYYDGGPVTYTRAFPSAEPPPSPPPVESPYRAPWPASEEAESGGFDIGMWNRERAPEGPSASAVGKACSIDRIAALQAEVLVLQTIVDDQHQQLLEHQAAMAEAQKMGVA